VDFAMDQIGGSTMIRRQKKQINKVQLIRAVASSSAIETGVSTRIIEIKLKRNSGKFKLFSSNSLFLMCEP
jgi:hypothetical protein